MNALSRQRLVLGVLAAVLAAAAAFPAIALQPIASLVSQMRRPEDAADVVRAFAVVAALLVSAVACAWPSVIAAKNKVVVAVASWAPGRFWLTVGVVALLPRVLVAWGLPYEPTSDAGWYHEVAASLARGDGFVLACEPTAYRSPGYPLLLSVLYRLGGPHVAWAWAIGALATAALLWAVFAVSARLHGENVARVATLLSASYPAFVLMTGQALSDLVFVAGLFALLACVLRSDGGRARDAIFVGVATGLLTLCRSVGAALVVLLPAAWWFMRADLRLYARNIALAACACAVVVLPWMARNAIALDRFTVGTNAGSNLLVGNRPGASGWRDAYDLPAKVLAIRGEVARDDAMRAEALAFVRQHPGQALAILPGKLAGMYLLETQAVTSLFQGDDHAGDGVRHALYGISQLAWMLVGLLVLARMGSFGDPAERPRGAQLAGWLLVTYFTAVCLVFHGEDRYRLPIMPWFLIEAAVVLAATQPRRRSISPLSSSSEAN